MTNKVDFHTSQQQTTPVSKNRRSRDDSKVSTAALPNLKYPTAATGQSFAIEVVPHEEESTHTMAAFQQSEHPHTYKHESTVVWEFKRYLFTLSVPLWTPADQLTEPDRKKLEETITKYKELFIQDLAKHKTETIKPGADFQILFTENGYSTFIPSKDGQFFDPNEMPIETANKNGYFSSYQSITTDSAKTLSQIIQTGKVESLVGLTNQLTAQKPKPPVQTQPQPNISQPQASTLSPIGLFNLGSSCYLNSALQLWATNPIIRDELRPDLFKEKDQNPLYQTLLAYKNGSLTKSQLETLKTHLNLKPGQGDVHDALQKMQAQLIYDPNSKLACKIKTEFRHASNVWIPAESPPVPSMIPQKIITLTPQKTFAELYEQEDLLEGHSFKAKREIYETSPDIELIHINRTGWTDGNKTKIDTEIEDIPLSFNGKELSSFSLHLGKGPERGHYITYIRDKETYWKCNDETISPVGKDEFTAQLKQATDLVYTKIAPTKSPAKSASFTPIEEKDVKHTKIVVGLGEITKRPGTLVNFTNSTLDLDTSIYRAGNMQSIVDELREQKKGRLFNKEGIFSSKEIVESKPGGLTGVNGILHAVRDPSYSKSGYLTELPDLIQKTLHEAHKKGIQQISFPIPDGIEKDWVKETYQIMSQEIAEYTHDHQNDLHPFTRIEIVLTAEQNDLIQKKDDTSLAKVWKEPAKPLTS